MNALFHMCNLAYWFVTSTAHASSMFKNKIDKYLRRAGNRSPSPSYLDRDGRRGAIVTQSSQALQNGWILDKPMASLSTCHLNVLPLMAMLLNQGKS